MKEIRAVIIDDERGAHKILEKYIDQTANINLIGSFFNVVTAAEFLKRTVVDLIFLDITLPELDGFSLLDMLITHPLVIFTTAHSEYAVRSYEYDAVDYLKKPIRFERFLKATEKANSLLAIGLKPVNAKEFIAIRVNDTNLRLPVNKVLYIQSLGNYVKVFTGDKVYITLITMKQLEEELPKSVFLRIHKSYIINKQKIDKATDDKVNIGFVSLTIGKTYKKYVKEYFLNFRSS